MPVGWEDDAFFAIRKSSPGLVLRPASRPFRLTPPGALEIVDDVLTVCRRRFTSVSLLSTPGVEPGGDGPVH